MVNGDGDRLMQVLANFISNAAKYSPAGGVVTVGAERHESRIRIYVRDKGQGIPQDFMTRCSRNSRRPTPPTPGKKAVPDWASA